MTEPNHRATFGSALAYKDPGAAIEWLKKAFGFEVSLLITDDDGKVVHSELSYGNGYIMAGGEWTDHIKAPSSVGGANTQTVHVQLSEDIDAHCERARAAGARIAQEPEDQFYGDRTYRAFDSEGHMWTFGQTVKQTTPADWEAAMPGLKVREGV
ncbi:MAG TPA: VOC family protein [Dehalococcoidia bacterium]|nr:VOC family protein [Dehalococcoidia bacterium]